MAVETNLTSSLDQHPAGESTDNVERLLNVLRIDIEHIERSLDWLNDLRALVIKRDDKSLAELLEVIRRESAAYAANELERHTIRQCIAADMNCEPADVTLSMLENTLSPILRERIADTKTQLKELTAKLKAEHNATAMLLTDSARFNSMLLTGILNLAGAETVTYQANGSTGRRTGAAFVDMKF